MNPTFRTVLVLTLAMVVLPLLWGLLMMGGTMMGGSFMGGMGPGMMGGGQGVDGAWRWGGLLMMVPGVLIIGGVVAALVWALGSSDGVNRSVQPGAREILDARYARGEISREEYQQMKADLVA